ncbi:LacI family DNA-binding transcriptional regulator [Microbacterium sp. Root553]|uniref:LacI family DNA-binding transcriptional regulator n=1 Tax=Microbacterium sp. Root553 TaxID=1736556 RepID=UPI000AE62D0E|nr:LacI family DNA-binding transcriptional regulator [Microbacterium sp. Root553]
MTADARPARRATSKDVAASAGVSRSTVSQILNGDERFPAETRDRVRAAAEALNYRPSRAGRALVTGLSDIVVVVVPHATFGSHLQDSVDRITGTSATAGMSVVVRFARMEDETTLTSVLDLRPAAVVDMGVFTPQQRERIEASGTFVVPRRAYVAEGADADPDPIDIEIGRLQVRELLRNGPRRLVYAALEDKRLDPFGPPRLEGIRREAQERGLDAPLTPRIPLDLQGATKSLKEVREQAGAAPLGICAYNDDVAIAVVAASRGLGLRVPEDVAVIGVDGTAVGQLVSPRLSTVAIDQPLLMDALVQDLATLSTRRADADDPQDELDLRRVLELVRGETT